MDLEDHNHVALVQREQQGPWKVVSGEMRLRAALSTGKRAKVKDIHSGKVLFVDVDASGQWCFHEEPLN